MDHLQPREGALGVGAPVQVGLLGPGGDTIATDGVLSHPQRSLQKVSAFKPISTTLCSVESVYAIRHYYIRLRLSYLIKQTISHPPILA